MERLRLQREYSQSNTKKEATPVKTAEQIEYEKRQADVHDFLAEYGVSIDTNSIPREVWHDVMNGKTLTSAYQAWTIKSLKAENETLKKNNENKEKATGSRATAGATSRRQEIEEDWYRE